MTFPKLDYERVVEIANKAIGTDDFKQLFNEINMPTEMIMMLTLIAVHDSSYGRGFIDAIRIVKDAIEQEQIKQLEELVK